MELFVIHCTTCRARLKVHNESAIGEILACPKCHSMVQVAPPEGWRKGAAAVSAGTNGAPTNGAATNGHSKSKNAKPASDGLSVAAGSAAGAKAEPVKAPPALVAASSDDIAAALASVVPPAVVPPPIPETIVSAPVELSAWQRIVGRVQQDRWLFGGAAAAGAAVGLGVWLAVISSASDPVVAEAPQVVAHEAQRPTVEPATTSSAPEVPAPGAAQLTPEPTAHEAAQAVAAQPVEAPATAVPALPPEQDDALAGAIPRFAPNAAVPPVQPALVGPGPGANSPPSVPATPPATGTAPAPPADGVSPAVAAMSPATPLRTPDEIRSQLGERMLAIEFSAVPLGQFVEFLAGFSTLPIVIDRDSLAALNKGAASPVTVKLERTTVADALRAALSQHGLVFVVRDGRIIITTPAVQ